LADHNKVKGARQFRELPRCTFRLAFDFVRCPMQLLAPDLEAKSLNRRSCTFQGICFLVLDEMDFGQPKNVRRNNRFIPKRNSGKMCVKMARHRDRKGSGGVLFGTYWQVDHNVLDHGESS